VHIQSRADSDDVNDGIMAMVMIAMMIVLVMVNIVPEALYQVDSVHQHSCKPTTHRFSSAKCIARKTHLLTMCASLSCRSQALRCYVVIKQTLKEAIKQAYKQNIKLASD
jgi:hypothetical protein